MSWVCVEEISLVLNGSVVAFVTGAGSQVSLQVAVTTLTTISALSHHGLLMAAQHQLGQLLHQVDEEEACTDHQLRQELQL